MDHPLVNLNGMSESDLQEKIVELRNRFFQTQNLFVRSQIQHILLMYENKLIDVVNEKAAKNEDFTKLIKLD